VLLGINPGGGGTQRLTRLIGTHRSLVAILEGKPFTPAEAIANGAVDELVPQEKVVARAVELAEYSTSWLSLEAALSSLPPTASARRTSRDDRASRLLRRMAERDVGRTRRERRV
jgi:enoyl-CoA hydratase/carnithine racemase